MKSLYEKTIAFVLQYMNEHGLEVGAQLPTENQISSLAGVSLVTVRRALGELAAQGVVRREQGRGTFVARPRGAAAGSTGSLHLGLHLDTSSLLSTQILECRQRPASEDEAAALSLSSAGAIVWEVSRLRHVNKRPLIWESSVIPKILAPDLGARLAGRDDVPLHQLLEAQYGIKEAREEQMLVSRPALSREIELLNLAGCDWVMEVSGVSFSTQHAAIDAFRMVFVANSFAFRLETAPHFFIEAIELRETPTAQRH